VEEPPVVEEPEFSIKADRDLYTSGATILISGKVWPLNENYPQAVTAQIVDPENERVFIGQVIPNADGFYSFETTAGGTWALSGTYTIMASYGAQRAQETFEFTGGDGIPPPPPPPEPDCIPLSFVDQSKDPQYYLDRYYNEPTYKDWFDTNFPGMTIEEGICLDSPSNPPPVPEKLPEWVRNLFIWYAEKRISEAELLDAIQFLIDQGILKD